MRTKIILILIMAAISIFAVEFSAEYKDAGVLLKVVPEEISLNAATYIVIYDSEKFDLRKPILSNSAEMKIVENPGRLAIYSNDNSSYEIRLAPKTGFENANFELRTYVSQDATGNLPQPNIDFDSRVISLKGKADGEHVEIGNSLEILAYPNPFRDKVDISIDNPVDGHVNIAIYDILGKEIKKLHSGDLEKGNYSFHWNGQSSVGENLPQGIYFCRYDGGTLSQIEQLYLID